MESISNRTIARWNQKNLTKFLSPQLEQSVKNKKSLIFSNLNIDWNLQAEENSTDFSDEDFNEEKLNAKDYFDWLLNSRTNGEQLNARKKGADVSSIISNDTLLYRTHLAGSGQQSSSDSQSRSSSVLDQFPSIQASHSSVARLNAKNQPPVRPPPLPPHSNKVKQAISAINSSVPASNAINLSNAHNNNNQNLANLNNPNSNLSKKDQFLSGGGKSVMHSRTISDLGLKASLGGHRKNASMDLQITNNHQKSHSYLADKNLKRRTYIDSCTQLNLEGSLSSLKRPAVPPPMLPVSHRSGHSTSQSNLLASGNFNSNQFINSLNNNNIVNSNNCKNDSKLMRRKQAVYIESRHHLSNGQSFESLPSSDDLNNSNNSGSNHHHNLIHNSPAVLHSYDPKFSPVPVPPPRRRENAQPTNSNKRCLALFDCQKDAADELEFKKNEIIEILRETTLDEQWMYGRIGDRKGVFPSSFVQMLD